MIDAERGGVRRTLAYGLDGGDEGKGDDVSGDSTAAAARTQTGLRRTVWLGLCACAASIALLAIQGLASARLELTFDEAYYTLWSRALSFGYLDHPPMVALLIRASTSLFGGSELGVRALSLLVVGAMPALVAFIAWRLFRSKEKAALAALIWVAMPLVSIGAVFVTPDAPLVVFWTLGLAALIELWRTGEKRWLIALGVALGLAFNRSSPPLFLRLASGSPSSRRPRFAAGFARLRCFSASPSRSRSFPRSSPGTPRMAGRLSPSSLAAPPHGFTPYYLGEFLVAQIGLVNPLVFFAFIAVVSGVSWRARAAAGSSGEARRILVCTIAPAALYFLLHSLHDRVQGNWLAPLYPAVAILVADWAVEIRSAHASGLAAAIAKAVPWATAIGLVVAALAFAEAATSAVPLGSANPLARLEGFRDLARDLDARARAGNAPYVLTQGYALTSLMTYYGDPQIAVVQPEQRMRWMFDPEPPASMFTAPGLALGEPGRHFDLLMKMRFRTVEPAGVLNRRQAGGALEAYELYRVADPYAPVLDPVCERGEVNLQRRCGS